MASIDMAAQRTQSSSGTSSKISLKDEAGDSPPASTSPRKGWSFWMIILSLAIVSFLSALDLTALSTALPTIAQDLRAENFSWIASSYALSSTVFIPVFAGLCNVFGRKCILLTSILFFAAGSALCGAARSIEMMIVGRTIAGVGGGGILASVDIILADLVPLAERGLYIGLLGLVWAISSAIGPVMGGLLADADWRWLFWLNLPISGLSFGLVLTFMQLRLPAGSFREKIERIDWIGNALFLVSSTSVILGLTFGGDTFPWKSAATLVSLVGGTLLLAVFFWVEKVYVKEPIIPYILLSNRTTLAGYLETIVHGIVSMGVIYFLPIYMQMRGHDGVESGKDLFTIAFLIAPIAIITGVSVQVTGKYKVQNYLIWIFCIAGSGLLLLSDADASWTTVHGSQTLVGMGLGIGYTATVFAVLAPLPPCVNAVAMGTYGFARAFGQVLGIAIGTATFANQLAKKLPDEFAARLPGGPASAFAAIRHVSTLSEPLKTVVQVAFVDSLKAIWYVLIGVSFLGLAISFGIQGIPLNSATDESWGIASRHDGQASEAVVSEKLSVPTLAANAPV